MSHLSKQLNCWSLRCSWSIARRRCSNYIFILDLTPGFNGLGKDNCKTRRESFKFCDLVRLILEILRYIYICVYTYVYMCVYSCWSCPWLSESCNDTHVVFCTLLDNKFVSNWNWSWKCVCPLVIRRLHYKLINCLFHWNRSIISTTFSLTDVSEFVKFVTLTNFKSAMKKLWHFRFSIVNCFQGWCQHISHSHLRQNLITVTS